MLSPPTLVATGWRALASTPALALHGPFHRSVFSVVPSYKVREVTKMPKAIHVAESIEAPQHKTTQVVAKLGTRSWAKRPDRSPHQSVRPWPITLFLKPTGAAPVRSAPPRRPVGGELAEARLRHVAGTQWGIKRTCLAMDELFNQSHAAVAA